MTEWDFLNGIFKSIEQHGFGGAVLNVVLLFLIVTLFIQFSRLPWEPWTWMLSKIGDALYKDVSEKIDRSNKETMEKLDRLEKKVESLDLNQKKHAMADEKKEMLAARRRILRANDEVINRVEHSKEFWDDLIQEDIPTYETYSKKHSDPDKEDYFQNGKCPEAVKNLRRVYEELQASNGFLVRRKKEDQ